MMTTTRAITDGGENQGGYPAGSRCFRGAVMGLDRGPRS